MKKPVEHRVALCGPTQHSGGSHDVKTDPVEHRVALCGPTQHSDELPDIPNWNTLIANS